MLADRRDNARLQSDFYRDQFRKMLRWLMMTVAIIFLFIAIIIYLIFMQPERQYFASTTEGKILTMPPLSP